MVHAERKGPGRRLRHVGHDNYFVGGISDEVSPAARYRRRRRSSDRAGRVWPARGDGRRGIATSGVRSAGVRPLLQRRERQADARRRTSPRATASSSWSASGATAARPPRASPTRRATRTPRCCTSRPPSNTEESVWTAPITAGGGTQAGDHGHAERQGRRRGERCRSTRGSRPRPAPRRSTGPHRRRRAPRRRAGTVASGATAATTAGNELAVGMYVDSGFGDTLDGRSRLHRSAPTSRRRLEHRPARPRTRCWRRSGATPNATAGAGANTVWLMAHGRVPGRRSGGAADGSRRADRRVGDAGDGSATVTLDRARRRRQPDHELHGDAVRRVDRADADDRQRSQPADHATVNGLTNGTPTRSRSAPPTRSAPGRRPRRRTRSRPAAAAGGRGGRC